MNKMMLATMLVSVSVQLMKMRMSKLLLTAFIPIKNTLLVANEHKRQMTRTLPILVEFALAAQKGHTGWALIKTQWGFSKQRKKDCQ